MIIRSALLPILLAAPLADLMVYLRQPAPDAQRLRVGQAVAERNLNPKL